MKTQQLALVQGSKDAIASYIRAVAGEAHAAYPQYKGHWDGPEWQIVQVLAEVSTKAGLAFTKGELTLARVEEIEGKSTVVAYSTKNRIDTALPPETVYWV